MCSAPIKPHSNGGLLSRYLSLSQPTNQVQVTYVWIDGQQQLRSKSRTIHFTPTKAEELPVWSFDGSSTYQCDDTVDNSDVRLLPVRLYRDPFRKGHNRLVLCETTDSEGRPIRSNSRRSCVEVMRQVADQEPWFGVEQEYFLMEAQEPRRPLGWPKGSFGPRHDEPVFCGLGPKHIRGRDVAVLHYRACLYAGIQIDGINAEGNKSQWEFQVGPCEGVRIGDDLWMARYVLHRLAEDYHIVVTLDPKPVLGHFGSGCHTNFSTKAMRQTANGAGLAVILEAMPKLERNHRRHIEHYDPNGGRDNARRLVASVVTASLDHFCYGLGDRAASVRIPKGVVNQGGGYFEDRRPSSNMDPYVVTEMLIRTVCLDQ